MQITLTLSLESAQSTSIDLIHQAATNFLHALVKEGSIDSGLLEDLHIQHGDFEIIHNAKSGGCNLVEPN